MATFIRRSSIVETESYVLSFDYEGHDGWGFGFPCDKAGNVEPLADVAAENYRKCLTGEADGRKVINRGVTTYHNRYTEPAIIVCACGAHVTLGTRGADAGCDHCDREYNTAGQELAPREQWGEETGETFADLSINPDQAFEE